jgi:hypothetical protein
MIDFEEEIKTKSSRTIRELVMAFKQTVQANLKETPELITLKNANFKEYMKHFEDKYPHFANRFPFLFDKIIAQPDNLQFLDFLLNQLDSLTESNFDTRTQTIANIVAENREKI